MPQAQIRDTASFKSESAQMVIRLQMSPFIDNAGSTYSAIALCLSIAGGIQLSNNLSSLALSGTVVDFHALYVSEVS